MVSISQQLSAQLKLVDSIENVSGKQLRVDFLGNCYVVAKDNSIVLITKRGTRFTHNEKSLGKVQNIDVSNPMRILLYYAEANTIMYLDNTLTELGRVDLSKFNIYGQNTVVGNSKMGGFWVYDPIQQSLKRLDIDGREFTGTQLNSNWQSFNTQHLIERDGIIYISSELSGLYTFDINGTYASKFGADLSISENFQVTSSQIIWYSAESIHFLNLNSLAEKKVPLPKNLRLTKVRNTLYCTDEKCYALMNNRLYIYKIN